MGKTGGRFPPSREHKKYATATLLCGAERAARAWQLCRRHRGQPLTDADGQLLKVGSTVVDSKFGEGIARGTVPLEKGGGVNVLYKSTGVGGNNAGKSPSRGIENLKLA